MQISFDLFFSFLFFSGMQKKSFRKRCCLMSVWESIVKPKKHTILGIISTLFSILRRMLIIYALDKFDQCYVVLVDISFTGFCFVHLVEDQKMTGIIMETKDLTLLVLYLVACSEWFVLTEFGSSLFLNFFLN